MKPPSLFADAGTHQPIRLRWKRQRTRSRRVFSDWIFFHRRIVSFAALLTVAAILPTLVWADFSAFVNEAKQALEQHRYESAVSNFTGALSMLSANDPANCTVLLGRAQAYFGLSKFLEAITDVNSALGCQGIEGDTLAAAYRIRGSIYHRRGNNVRALSDLTESIKVYPQADESLALTFTIRGFVLGSLGKLGRARGDFNKAIQLKPDSSLAYAGLATVYSQEGRSQEAQRAAEQALSMNPDEETARIAQQVLSGKTGGDGEAGNHRTGSLSGESPSRQRQSVLGTGPRASSIAVPFRTDGHVHVKVRFGDGRPYWFLLDTGASHSMIKRALLQRIKSDTDVQELGKGKAVVADGSVHQITAYRVKNAYLYDIPLGDIVVTVPDLPLTNVSNLLGSSSLKTVTIYLDRGSQKAVITPK